MPILDPTIQLTLLNQFKNSGKGESMKKFFLTLLQISSKKQNQNRKMYEASKKFRKNLPKYISFLNSQLRCQITDENINQRIYNIYEFLLDNMGESNRNISYDQLIGDYFVLTDQYQTKLFQPDISKDSEYTWFISDNPIAILCIRNKISNEPTFSKIQLEIDLFSASGYTLVLCVLDHEADNLDFYKKLIGENQFSEIHINCNNFFQEHLKKHFEFNEFKQYKGYFYLYTCFIYKNDKELSSIKKIFKQLPHVKVISFTGENIGINNENMKLIVTKPFVFYSNNFDYLRVRLSNVALYNSENDISSNQTSGISIGYIHQNDFLNFTKFKIEILFDGNSNDLKKQYINFEDLYLIRPDLYMNDQLLLAKVDEKTLKKCQKLKIILIIK